MKSSPGRRILTPMRKSNSQRLYRGAGALILASVFNHFADRILGIKIEAFSGNVLQYFSPLWVLDMFLVPFLAGVLVSAIYGFGGKWLSYFPPLFLRGLRSIAIAHITGVPPGDVLIPLGWWGFFVIPAPSRPSGPCLALATSCWPRLRWRCRPHSSLINDKATTVFCPLSLCAALPI